jgi:hypothetical protein
MCRPPSKRITISATTPMRSTVWIESASRIVSDEAASPPAPSRKSAALGTEIRSATRIASTARNTPAETTRTIAPKSEISLIR